MTDQTKSRGKTLVLEVELPVPTRPRPELTLAGPPGCAIPRPPQHPRGCGPRLR
jgi:hypothetical protein